jgi:hypothetical protein
MISFGQLAFGSRPRNLELITQEQLPKSNCRAAIS